MHRIALCLPFVVSLACDAKPTDAKTEPKPDTKVDSKADANPESKTDTEVEPKTDPKPGAAATRLTGHVELPGDQKLEFRATLQPGDDGYSGTIDIPMQGAKGIALSKVTVTDSQIGFALENGATWKGTIGDDGKIACSFSQSGMEMKCSMVLADDAAFAALEPKRLQTPVAPFPYDSKDIEWDAGEGVHLAGTVVTPKGAGPHPAVVFISGSGQQDRDETLLGHKPFAVLADKLARSGIASLRYDDRGAGKSTGDLTMLTMTLEADDAASALDQLRKTDGIDPKRIGIVGHSAGGVIGPIVAAKRPKDVAFLVLIAGTGVVGKALHKKQAEALMKAGGAPQAEIDKASKTNEAVYKILASDKSEEQRTAALREILGESGIEGPAADLQVAALNSVWFRDFLEHDPGPALEKTTCPVLVLNGELDMQVLAAQNVPAIEAALAKGGNTDITVERFPGFNHLLQAAKTGMPDEYATIETTMDPKAISVIDTWVRAKTGV
ncbi:MAG: alpha/beta hydrolase [Nannocystaceae bacterium]|nr:alpha/beta hydrolase [Nannocystaceae bacterium]